MAPLGDERLVTALSRVDDVAYYCLRYQLPGPVLATSNHVLHTQASRTPECHLCGEGSNKSGQVEFPDNLT